MNDQDDTFLWDGQFPGIEDVQDDKMAFLLGDCYDRLQHAYRTMNWFASGESQDQYSRVLPTDILGEVYFILAPVFEHMKILNNPKSSAKAKNWYETSLENERQRMLAKIADTEHNALHQIEQEQRRAARQVEAAESKSREEIREAKAKIDAMIRKAVEKAVKKTEDRLKGRQRTIPGSGRTVRL